MSSQPRRKPSCCRPRRPGRAAALLLAAVFGLASPPVALSAKQPTPAQKEAELKRVNARIEKVRKDVSEDIEKRDKLSAQLRDRYAAELAHPKVTVTVRTFTKQRVSVAGEVTDPGIQPLLHGLTLSQAIHHAGGFLKSAHRGQVIVIRRHADGTVSGHAVDLEGVENGHAPGDDVPLQALDQVYVPRSQIASVNLLVEMYIRNNVPVNSLGIGLTPF